MEAFFIILSIFLVAGGVIFSILPPLPGPLLSYLGLFAIDGVSDGEEFSTTALVIWGIIAGIILVADYLLPIAATKKFGGTKAGVIGGAVGMIAGVLLPIPFGIVLGPLLGAVLGDLYGGNRIRAAFKSGFGSFLGFVAATSLKVLYSVILGGVIAWKIGGFTLSMIQQSFQ